MCAASHRPVHAVIDVGSKSVRLLVARQLSSAAFEVVDEERFDARLGEGQSDGALTPAAIERGLRAMRVVSQVARSYEPAAIVAVGTEALRQARNAESFIERAFIETSIRIRVLEAHEEAAASFVGVANGTGLDSATVVDIGGGSLEVMQVEARRLERVYSVPLGAIYATEKFFRSDPPSGREVRELRHAVRASIENGVTSPTLYGSGGAIRSLARMVRIRREHPLRRLHGFVIERRELSRLARDLCDASASKRRTMRGLNPERVATLPAAAVVIDEVMDVVGATELNVSGQGMREGLVWQEMRGGPDILPDVRTSSIAGLAAANGVDILAAEPRVDAARRLFEETQPLHRYGPADLDLLLHATRLAGIGVHIDYYNSDRHAEYLVHSGDLHGFTHREIVLLAGIVRWAMVENADLKAYKPLLERGDRDRVRTLAAFLGVARAAWRRKDAPVTRLDATLADDRLQLTVHASEPIDAELYALEYHAARLEDALGINVTLVGQT